MDDTVPVTFGQPQRTASLRGFRVTEAVYPPHLKVRAHEHRFNSWTACVAGSFEERFTHETHTCVAGSVLSKSGLARHSNRYGAGGARILLIELTDPGQIGAENRGVFDLVQSLPKGKSNALVRRLYREFRVRDRGWRLALESSLLDVWLLFVRRSPRPVARKQGWLRRVAERLRDEFASPPSLDNLAHDAGLHPVYLCSAFRAHYGCTPGQFVRRIRLEAVRDLLTRTADPLSAIAFATGFSDQSHLTRQFRVFTGITPAEYRRRHG